MVTGEVDRDQQEERHRARIAIGFQDHRHADENRIGLTGRKARNDAGHSLSGQRKERPISMAATQTTATPTK